MMKKRILCISFCLILIAALSVHTFVSAADSSDYGAVYTASNNMIFESVLVKNLDTPMAGNKPDYTVTRGNNDYSIFPGDGIIWYDQTDRKTLSEDDTFVAGHNYSVRIWLKAKIDLGYTFKVNESGEPAVTATLNDQTVKVNQVDGQDPMEVIELYCEFGACPAAHNCSLRLVDRVEPTCTQSGKEAYYHCSCGINYKDGAGEQAVSISTWGDIPALGHTSSGWNYNDTHHYKECTRTGCRSVIPNTEIVHSGGTANCMQRANCMVCGALYGNLADHNWTFDWNYQDETGHAHTCETAGCTAHSTVKAHNPGAAATDATPQTCRDCGYIIKAALNHTHSLEKVSAGTAICMDSGNREYYTCSGCSDWFQDSKGENKILDKGSVILAPLGHKLSVWKSDAELHWRECHVCKEIPDETRAVHNDDNQDSQCDICTCVIESATDIPSEPNNPAEPTTPVEPTQFSEDTVPAESTEPPETQDAEPNNNSGIPWWGVLLIAICAAGLGAVAAYVFLKVVKKT